jgi:transposase-like protein
VQVLKLLQLLTSEAAAVNLLRKVRWQNGVLCPYCGSEAIKWCRYKKLYQRYACKNKACKSKTFNDKSGTIFAYSRLPLRAWFLVLLLWVVVHISQRALAYMFGVSVMSAFRWGKKLRERLVSWNKKQELLFKAKPLDLEWEVDEVYQVAGLKGANYSEAIQAFCRAPRKRGLKKRGRGTFYSDKVAILGLICRKGVKVLVMVRRVLSYFVLKVVGMFVREGGKVYTDDFASYRVLDGSYMHYVICHSMGWYADGRVHVNLAEGEFSVFRLFMGVHRGVNKENMAEYLAWYNAHRKVAGKEGLSALSLVLEMVIS